MHTNDTNLKKIFAILLMVLFCFIFGQKIVLAAENKLVISPSIIDATAKARDILSYKIKLTNTGSSTMSLYPIVKELSLKDGVQATSSDINDFDRKTSLIRWIQIARGVRDISPGQEIEIPLIIDVNMYALPGLYHASINFSQGSSQPEALSRTNYEIQPELLININVEDDIIEKAQIVQFKTDKNIFLKFPVRFLTEVRNLGNNDIAPSGSIMIFDRRGQEIQTLEVNEDAKMLAPETNIKYVKDWNGNSSFGKFKAIINLEYGTKNKRDLTDVIYFWVLPINLIIILGSVFLFIFIIFLYLIVKILRPKENIGKPRDGTINLREFK